MKYNNMDELERDIDKEGKTVLTREDKKSVFFDTTTLTQIIMVLLARLNAAGKESKESAEKTTELVSKINTSVCKTLDLSGRDMKDVLLQNAKMAIKPRNAKQKGKLSDFEELILNIPDGDGAEA
tara:strand:+ start:66 stop:440 length:375 start_codon:yes stop_codon:yes gene_type:complete